MQHELPYPGYHWPQLGFPAFLSQQPYWLLLDSNQHPLGRYDILCGEPYIQLIQRQAELQLTRHGDAVALDSRQDPFDLLQNFLPLIEDSDLPFNGGLVAALSYDLARHYESVPQQAQADIDWPELIAGIHDWALIIDHQQQRAVLCHQGQDPQWPLPRLLAELSKPWSYRPRHYQTGHWQTSLNPTQYAQAFEQIKQHLAAGDCYQINFSRRFDSPFSGDPLAAYLDLRKNQQAPFSSYWQHPQGQILCLSPERFLQCDGSQVTTWPIKGTRPRQTDPQQDRLQQQALQNSLKDRAENLMIVDLLRNDLSRHCQQVRVPSLFEIQSFSQVHHLVSRIEGQLNTGHHPLSLLRDAFPGGSITGAPKIQAMRIIEQLEPKRRSLYCGSLMYLGFNGKMDSNICIRTLIAKANRLYCWGGGGIVMDSQLEQEYQEIDNKIGSLLHCLQQHSKPLTIDLAL